MQRRLALMIVLTCSAAVGCGADRDAVPTRPTPPSPPAPATPPPREAPIFTTLKLYLPEPLNLEEGEVQSVSGTALDQFGASFYFSTGTMNFWSDDSSVVRITPLGFMTAVSPGSTSIQATMTIGAITRPATGKVIVTRAVVSDSVAFSAGPNGWEPYKVHVAAGGGVSWSSPAIGWQGIPNTMVYLMDPANSSAGLDSVDLSSGSASRRFTKPGAVSFCSGGCWDPGDWGMIYVH